MLSDLLTRNYNSINEEDEKDLLDGLRGFIINYEQLSRRNGGFDIGYIKSYSKIYYNLLRTHEELIDYARDVYDSIVYGMNACDKWKKCFFFGKRIGGDEILKIKHHLNIYAGEILVALYRETKDIKDLEDAYVHFKDINKNDKLNSFYSLRNGLTVSKMIYDRTWELKWLEEEVDIITKAIELSSGKEYTINLAKKGRAVIFELARRGKDYSKIFIALGKLLHYLGDLQLNYFLESSLDLATLTKNYDCLPSAYHYAKGFFNSEEEKMPLAFALRKVSSNLFRTKRLKWLYENNKWCKYIIKHSDKEKDKAYSYSQLSLNAKRLYEETGEWVWLLQKYNYLINAAYHYKGEKEKVTYFVSLASMSGFDLYRKTHNPEWVERTFVLSFINSALDTRPKYKATSFFFAGKAASLLYMSTKDRMWRSLSEIMFENSVRFDSRFEKSVSWIMNIFKNYDNRLLTSGEEQASGEI